jgi:hypothetical protein
MIAAPLPFHVVDIVTLRTKKEVLWIDAETIVACVANADAARNITFENLPSNTMRQLRFPLESDRSIASTTANCANPHVAAVWSANIDLIHESVGCILDIECAPPSPCFHVEHYGLTVRKNQ